MLNNKSVANSQQCIYFQRKIRLWNALLHPEFKWSKFFWPSITGAQQVGIDAGKIYQKTSLLLITRETIPIVHLSPVKKQALNTRVL